MPSSVRPTTGTSTSLCGRGGTAPDRHAADGSSSTSISSGHPAGGVDAPADENVACVVMAKAATATDCSTVGTGTSGAPAPRTEEDPALPPAVTLADGGRDGRTARRFRGANCKGSKFTLQRART